jgi:hypothetical protein
MTISATPTAHRTSRFPLLEARDTVDGGLDGRVLAATHQLAQEPAEHRESVSQVWRHRQVHPVGRDHGAS